MTRIRPLALCDFAGPHAAYLAASGAARLTYYAARYDAAAAEAAEAATLLAAAFGVAL